MKTYLKLQSIYFFKGYYADHLSIAQEVRGNHTVRIKNESRGFHLNNLSYAGPIVMGVGGVYTTNYLSILSRLLSE